MLRSLLLYCFLFFSLLCSAKTIIVKNIDELNSANAKAAPGDIIILQNGEWKDVTIALNCKGTEERPVTFKAQTPGKVLITGNSKLKIGGEYIIIDGFYFTNGYSGKDDVIDFRIDNKQLANNCRVTNTVIDDFNNPKRVDENNWVSFYGKRNRIDHCSFINKKNLGVLLAVLLDDDRSRENFHSIDHNYFGKRPPLASNGGEIIRIGLSQNCQFNSNTRVINNYFEECDGETEIISIKSCSNVIKENVFKQCQGAVVLRHGNDNTVENNIFFGDNKEGTGGVRIINKGQWIINNFFYKCRGVGFRSPLSIMNGIPNSPANRYVQVSDAVIANNTFVDCSPLSFCEGSDSERTLPPANTFMFNNNFYNQRDSNIYNAFDDISGIKFASNIIDERFGQTIVPGFDKKQFTQQKWDAYGWPVASKSVAWHPVDSLQKIAIKRLGHNFPATTGAADLKTFKKINAYTEFNKGAPWFIDVKNIVEPKAAVNCKTPEDIYKALEKNTEVTIQLTSLEYHFSKPLVITNDAMIRGLGNKTPVKFISGEIPAVFIVSKKGNLTLNNVSVDGNELQALHFICSDSVGYNEHYSFSIVYCSFQNFKKEQGCQDLFFAYKHTLADIITIHNNSFRNTSSDLFIMNDEKEDKGYYNAEKIFITHNRFIDQSGGLLDIYRGGVDESTLGPHLIFSHNKIENCNAKTPLIKLTGVQQTEIFSNDFSGCNPSGDLITYKDLVRAKHYLGWNKISNSGRIEKNKYVEDK